MRIPWLLLFVSLSFGEDAPRDGFLRSMCDTSTSSTVCVSDHWLECKDQRCSCIQGMIGDEDRKDPCVAPIKGQCQTQRTDLPVKNCPQNAHCVDGKCSCAEGFDAIPSLKRCRITHQSDVICTKDGDCILEYGLVCTQGHCVCPHSKVWDFKQGKCLLAIGSNHNFIFNLMEIPF